VDGASEQAHTILEKEEFDSRFATRLAEIDTYTERLLSLRNATDNSLVKFLKESSNKVRSLLRELRAPYGVCEVCGVNPRTKPFHRTCRSCFKPAPKPVVSEASDKDKVVTPRVVSRPRQPEKTAFAYAYENATEEKAQPKRFKTKKVNKKRKKDDFLEDD